MCRSLKFFLWWARWQLAEEKKPSLLFSPLGKDQRKKDDRRSSESILDPSFLLHDNFTQSPPFLWSSLSVLLRSPVQIAVLGINRLTVWQGQVVWSTSSLSSSLPGTAPRLWSGCLPHILTDLRLSTDGTILWQTLMILLFSGTDDSSVSKNTYKSRKCIKFTKQSDIKNHLSELAVVLWVVWFMVVATTLTFLLIAVRIVLKTNSKKVTTKGWENYFHCLLLLLK